MSGEIEHKLALKLVYELLERLRVVERNIEHLNNLVHFLSDYYNEYYRKKEYLDKNNYKENGRGSGIVYEKYKPALRLMREDIKDLQDFCKELILGIQTYIGNESKERKDFFEVKSSLFRKILYRGFGEVSHSGNKYEEFVKQKTLRDTKLSNIFDIVVTLRDLIEEDVKTYTVSLGGLNRAFACLAHSIEQSMSGLFVGTMIEHQPSVYTHKDLYHTMYYASLYCEGYNHSMRGLFERIFREDEKEVFYKVSGIGLQNCNGNKMEYTIVFGDCTLPQLLDRYKLIALPIICAYRPRYWTTLAHEISHSYLHGLMCCREIEEELSHLEEEKEEKDHEKKKLEHYKREEIRRWIIESLGYCADMIASDPYISRAFGRAFVARIDKKREKYFIGASTEIMADVFGFLLGGFAYIPALISNIALGRPDVIQMQKLPYALRVGVILAIARKFISDELEGISKPEKPLEILKKRINELTKKLDYESGWKVCKGVCNDFSSSLSEIDDFLNAYTNLFTNCLRSEKPKRFMYLDYILTFGIDLGKILYDRYVGKILKFILEQNLYFGWFPSKNKKPGEIKYVVLNLLLNRKSFERFKNIKNNKDLQELDKVLCLSNETVELYNQMKLIDWEVKKYELHPS